MPDPVTVAIFCTMRWVSEAGSIRLRRKAVPARLVGLLAVAALVTASFGVSDAHASSLTKATRSSKTVWLCRPGQTADPCTLSLKSTSVTATGGATVMKAAPSASAAKFDCFYVYPTVSSEPTANADLKVQPAEIVTAKSQASRFSQVCNVWAPMYRQRTLASLLNQNLGGDATATTLAYNSLLAGWKDFLAHDDNGKPIILIGHSQGAAILIKLIHDQIDPSPKLRKLMVSALIFGGNVQVPIGKTVGGSFQHIPTCGAAGQTGCVIAYSSFGTAPPSNALFGRPGQGVSLQSGQTKKSGQQVACVNPATLSPASGALLPYFLSVSAAVPGVHVKTPWESFPGLYTATCQSNGGSTWLQINATSVSGDPRPKVSATLGPTWGLHLYDVNLALGNLVLDVAFQEASYH
jgi:hypothetical protein